VEDNTLLIVDDDAFMRNLLTEYLSKAGYVTKVAKGGKQAINLISQVDFQVALVDLSLPDIGGMEVIDYLSKESPDTQTIIMTGYPSLQSAIDALRKGAQDYIVKPFKIPEIQAAISRALKNKKLQSEVESLRKRTHDLEAEVTQLRVSGITKQSSSSGKQTKRPFPGAYKNATSNRPSIKTQRKESPDETS